MHSCCNSTHPFETRQVNERWRPPAIRCLIVGENPGGPDSDYFYDPIPTRGPDTVAVRRHLLAALTALGLIGSPTLDDFRDAGFLFDHAIRCPLDPHIIDAERSRARRLQGRLVTSPIHLQTLLNQAERCWAMGLIARNAIANLLPDLPRDRKELTPPYLVAGIKNLAVSRYLTRMGATTALRIVTTVVELFDGLRTFDYAYERFPVDPDNRYPAAGLLEVERHAIQVLKLLPDAVFERTRDVMQIMSGGDKGIVVLITRDAIEIRLPTVEWTKGAYGPGPSSRLWRRLATPVGELFLATAFAAARKARVDEFRICRYCGQNTAPEHRYRDDVCHGCSSGHLGIVY